MLSFLEFKNKELIHETHCSLYELFSVGATSTAFHVDPTFLLWAHLYITTIELLKLRRYVVTINNKYRI